MLIQVITAHYVIACNVHFGGYSSSYTSSICALLSKFHRLSLQIIFRLHAADSSVGGTEDFALKCFIRHVFDGVKHFGQFMPHALWMFAYERFNSWLHRCVMNRRYPEVTLMETYQVG